MTRIKSWGLLLFYTSNNFPEQANSGAGAPLPSPRCEPGILPSWTWGACVEKTANRALGGNFAKLL